MKKSLILLSGLVAANVVPIGAKTAPERPAFSVRAEFFEALAGDRVSTEATEKGTGVRWDIRYPVRQNRVLAKSIPDGLLRDTNGMGFWIRGNGRHQLVLQLRDRNGECFSKFIHVAPQWCHLSAPYAEFLRSRDQADAEPVDPSEITKVSLIDYSASLNPQKRGRSVWLADWKMAPAP